MDLYSLVVCTGFGPVNDALRGRCVEPLHQQTIKIIILLRYYYFIIDYFF